MTRQRVIAIVPAYGRRYPSADAALADWHAGRDFKIPNGGPYLSIRDVPALQQAGYRAINLLVNYPLVNAFARIDLTESLDAIPQNV